MAVKYYEEALAKGEEGMIFHEDQPGLLYEEIGEYDKAIDFFEDRYKREKTGDTALHLSRLYRKAGQFESAWRGEWSCAGRAWRKERGSTGERCFLKGIWKARSFPGKQAEK